MTNVGAYLLVQTLRINIISVRLSFRIVACIKKIDAAVNKQDCKY